MPKGHPPLRREKNLGRVGASPPGLQGSKWDWLYPTCPGFLMAVCIIMALLIRC
jgi:hypothetical protein